MGRYNFTSPGAAAGNAIEAFFLQRAAEERQALLDAQAKEAQAAEIRQRDEAGQRAERALTQEREQNAVRAMEHAATQAALGDEREFRRASTVADTMVPGIVDGDTSSLLQKHGYGGLVERVDVPGTPGVMDTAGGFRWRQAREQEQARQETAQQAAAAAAERAAADRASRESIAAEGRETRRAIAGAASSSEPLVAVLDNNGNPVMLLRSQAVGKRPASSREQGRAVMSSDANRIAELDTSLDDVDVLSQQLGTTGAGSAIGAALPNVVTEFTGLGSDSKSRQGVIDRVRQVIGKALEGGVLRKEDEAKYAKILPTIGDPPDVATSKLQGLKQALAQRRQTLIEALRDAGYDASKFAARSSGGARVPVIAPDGRRGTVPEADLERALAEGYRLGR